MIFQDPESAKKQTYAAKNDVYEVKKESIWAFRNTVEECSPAQTTKLLDNRVFSSLIELLMQNLSFQKRKRIHDEN